MTDAELNRIIEHRRRVLARRRRWAKLLVAPVVVALIVAVGAVAYFTPRGAGTGSAATATAQQVTISAGAPSAALVPGGSGDVALSISNPNPIHVHVGSVQLDTSQGTGGFSVDGGHSGCSVSTLSYTSQNNGGAGWTVPAKVGAVNGTLALDLSGALSMGTGAANACQGASFTVYLKAGS